MTTEQRHPIPEWPGYTVSLEGEVYSPRGAALSCDSRGRVVLRKDARNHRVSIGLCLRMAGLLLHPQADKAGYDALVQRCYLLEDELAEVQKRLATHKDQTADIVRLEGERDKLFADLAEERKETAAAKAQAAKEKKARISAGPKSASKDADLERRLRWARKLNGHLLALIRKLRGIITDLESGKRTRASSLRLDEDIYLQPQTIDELP